MKSPFTVSVYSTVHLIVFFLGVLKLVIWAVFGLWILCRVFDLLIICGFGCWIMCDSLIELMKVDWSWLCDLLGLLLIILGFWVSLFEWIYRLWYGYTRILLLVNFYFFLNLRIKFNFLKIFWKYGVFICFLDHMCSVLLLFFFIIFFFYKKTLGKKVQFLFWILGT